MQPCEFEDSVDCYWDAQSMGNGIGESFTVDAVGNVTYGGYIEPNQVPVVEPVPEVVVEIPVAAAPTELAVTGSVTETADFLVLLTLSITLCTVGLVTIFRAKLK